MRMPWVQWIPTLFSLILQAGVLAVLRNRKLRTPYPLFFNYVAFSLLAVGFILFAGPYFSPMAYFYSYWVLNTLQLLLTLAVLFEVFINVLKPFSALIDLGKMLFLWAAGFLLVASILTALATTGQQAVRICAGIALLERSVELMQCGLLFLFVLFENRLGLSWRSRGMTIAIGLGTTAALDLIRSLVIDRNPLLTNDLNIASTYTYAAMWAFWVVMFLLPQPERQTVQDSPTRLVFQRWNEALISYGYGEAAIAASSMDSFLPNVEKTVERVMARKMMN